MLIWNPESIIEPPAPHVYGRMVAWITSHLERCRKLLAGW